MAGSDSVYLSMYLSIISLIHHQVIPQVSSFPSIQQQGIQGLQMTGLMENAVTEGSVLF